MAVSIGAVLLAWVLWQEDIAAARQVSASTHAPTPDTGNLV
jgi:hypothetical protein